MGFVAPCFPCVEPGGRLAVSAPPSLASLCIDVPLAVVEYCRYLCGPSTMAMGNPALHPTPYMQVIVFPLCVLAAADLNRMASPENKARVRIRIRIRIRVRVRVIVFSMIDHHEVIKC